MQTIKSSSEISEIFKNGKRLSSKYLIIIFSPRVSEAPDNKSNSAKTAGRVAFIAGKRNGNACWRNSAKRRMREIARDCQISWDGFDVLFVAKRDLTDAPYKTVLEVTKRLIRRSGIGT